MPRLDWTPLPVFGTHEAANAHTFFLRTASISNVGGRRLRGSSTTGTFRSSQGASCLAGTVTNSACRAGSRRSKLRARSLELLDLGVDGGKLVGESCDAASQAGGVIAELTITPATTVAERVYPSLRWGAVAQRARCGRLMLGLPIPTACPAIHRRTDDIPGWLSGSPIQKRIDIAAAPVSAATVDQASGILLLALQAFDASIQRPTALPLP